MSCYSSRSKEIFSCLCEQHTQSSLTKKFPTIREVRANFRCGQSTAAGALELLAEHFHFRRGLRRTKPRLDFSNPGSIDDFFLRKQECFLALPQNIAFNWMPLIDLFNQNHRRHITPQIIYHFMEYREIIAENAADFFLFPNHPVLLGIPQGLLNFIDLEPLTQNLKKDLYLPDMFLKDEAGSIRGIAPALIPKVICCNERLAQFPPSLPSMAEFGRFLKTVKQNNPALLYAMVINNYVSWFSNYGLDPAISLKNDFSDLTCWSEALEEFRSWYRQKLVPAVSDLDDSFFSLLFEQKTAMMELFLVETPRWSHEVCYSFFPRPVQPGVSYGLSSEVLAIAEGSRNYETAWEFIEFVLTPRVQQLLLSRMNGFSVIRELKPLNMKPEMYENLLPVLRNARRRHYENMLNPALFRCFESGIDRLIKYGGDLSRFFRDFSRRTKKEKE